MVDDNNVQVIWSPVPMAWYIAVPVSKIKKSYGVTSRGDEDRIFLDTVIRQNNKAVRNNILIRPAVNIIYNVAMVPGTVRVHIFWSYEPNFVPYLLGSVSEFGVVDNKLMQYYRRAISEQRRKIKPNYGISRSPSPLS